MKNKLALRALLTLLLLGGLGNAAYAQCSPGIPCTLAMGFTRGAGSADINVEGNLPSCDSDFMNQIYAKAFLEANREHVINQTMVLKPDSILEYTCFDQFASMTAGAGGNIFSDSTEWRFRGINIGATLPFPTLVNVWMGDLITGDKLDRTIERLVLNGLESYIDSNFAHSFLGSLAAIDSNISNNIGPNSYNCDRMQAVWNIAKCMDFGLEAGFLSFDELAAADPRRFPAQCGGGTGITPAIIDVARNDLWLFAGFDPVDIYSPLLLPPGGPIGCGVPLETGVTIYLTRWTPDSSGNTTREIDDYPDKVCSNPSCYYDPANDSCEP